jgi:glutathione synthase/RimK-type ligase-like ATP-grasp enzyme
MPRKRLLLVAATTGYQTQMFADAARSLGLDLTLATDRCHVLENPWGDQALPIRFDDPEAAASLVAAGGPFDGIVALGDRPAFVSAVLAAKLGLPYSSVSAVAMCRNKFLMRQRFQQFGLLVPTFFRVPVTSEPNPDLAKFPCVLKPLGLSASRGVIRANSPSEFVSAFLRIRAILQPLGEEQDRYIQVEDFIPGQEFALEAILDDDRLDVLALFDKPDPLDGPFFEETLYVTPSRQPAAVQEAIRETTAAAVQAIGLRQGPVHAEMRVNEQGVWMLEVAARPIGGLCARVLPGLPDRILKQAVGEYTAAGSLEEGVAAGVLMIPIPREGILHGVSGIDQARAVEGIEDVIVTAKEGQRLIPLPEGNSYLGFIFARAATPEQVEAALRAAHAALECDILTALPVL